MQEECKQKESFKARCVHSRAQLKEGHYNSTCSITDRLTAVFCRFCRLSSKHRLASQAPRAAQQCCGVCVCQHPTAQQAASLCDLLPSVDGCRPSDDLAQLQPPVRSSIRGGGKPVAAAPTAASKGSKVSSAAAVSARSQRIQCVIPLSSSQAAAVCCMLQAGTAHACMHVRSTHSARMQANPLASTVASAADTRLLDLVASHTHTTFQHTHTHTRRASPFLAPRT